MRVKKILAPTDLSENSRRGLDYAFSVAEESKAELIVLHVANEFQAGELYSDETAFNPDPWTADRMVSEAALDLNRFLKKHRDRACRVRALRKKVVLGQVVEKIVEIAEEEEADLIVMSPRAHGAMRRFFLGSVTDRVTREAPCPVLSVSVRRKAGHWGGKLVPSALLPLRHEEAST